jgi:hypothetical protein
VPTPQQSAPNTTVSAEALRELYAEFGETKLLLREAQHQTSLMREANATLAARVIELEAKYEPKKGAVRPQPATASEEAHQHA